MAPVQTWQVHSIEQVADDRVVVRASWSATLASDAGSFAAGTTLRAELAQFFELRGGRISRLETFDCYYPPASPEV
jgi:hypothetical protein